MANNQSNDMTNEEVRTCYSRLTPSQKVEFLNDMELRDARMYIINYWVMCDLMRQNQIQGNCQSVETFKYLRSRFSELTLLEKARVCDHVMLKFPFFIQSNDITIG